MAPSEPPDLRMFVLSCLVGVVTPFTLTSEDWGGAQTASGVKRLTCPLTGVTQ